MKPIEFPEQTFVYAKDQPQYLPLPAHFNQESTIATFCWKLTFRERLKLFFTGILWQQVLTFRQPLQPQLLLTSKPKLQ